MPQKPTSPPPDHDPLPGFETVPEPARVEVVEVIEPDPIKAMRHYVDALSALGAANEIGGFQIVARGMGSAASYDKALGWAGGDTGKLQAAVDFLDGSDMSERNIAQREYFSAVKALANHPLTDEDALTLQVGFMKFRNAYGTPGEGAKVRRSAKTKLEKAIKYGEPSIPVEMFYNPDVTMYTSSVLNVNDRPSWEHVVERIGKVGGDGEEILSTEVSALLRASNGQGDASLLTDDEAKLLAPTQVQLNREYIAIRRNKARKLQREADKKDGLKKRLTSDIFAAAVVKATKSVTETLDVRSKKTEARIQRLTLQADVLDRLGACSSEFPDRPFEVTSDTVAYIVGEIVPDIANVIARNQLFDEDMANNMRTALSNALFSEDQAVANETAKLAFWIVEDRARVLGESVAEMTKLKKGFGHAVLPDKPTSR